MNNNMARAELAKLFRVSENEVNAAGKLLLIFGHHLLRFEPVSASQLTEVYLESKFNTREFGHNKQNDRNSTVRRLLATWSKYTRETGDPTLQRNVECEVSGCVVHGAHRLCSRRERKCSVYYMRGFVWEYLYQAGANALMARMLKKVVITDPNLTFEDADNHVAIVYKEDKKDEEFDIPTTKCLEPLPVVNTQSFLENQDRNDALFDELFPFVISR
jgi:hypothetical protein